MREHANIVNRELLAKTIIKVSKDRGTLGNLDNFNEIIEILESSKIFQVLTYFRV